MYAVMALMGVVVTVRTHASEWPYISQGRNDFAQFYVGPRMLGTGELYNPDAVVAEQNRVLGVGNRNVVFNRLPYFALFFEPLSALPYLTAYVIWQVLLVAAFIGFFVLWPSRRALALVICCWYPAVGASFSNAQDVPFLLLWMAVAVWLVEWDWTFAAGLVLSLCLAKPHLFVFLPLVVVARRMWRFGAGLATGAAALLAISFLAAGFSWPGKFIHSLVDPTMHHAVGKSSILGFASEVLHGPALWAAAAALVVVLGVFVYRVSARDTFPLALAAAAAAGPLVAFHVYSQDYLMWLPLLFILLMRIPQQPVPSTASVQ